MTKCHVVAYLRVFIIESCSPHHDEAYRFATDRTSGRISAKQGNK